MAEEPTPAHPPPADQTATTTASTRSVAAASALSSHSATGSAEDETAILGRAVQNLHVGDGISSTKPVEEKKIVKVDAGDVAFLVSESFSSSVVGLVLEWEMESWGIGAG